MIRNEAFSYLKFLFIVSIILFFGTLLFAQERGKPLVLQEMSWTDVRDYLRPLLFWRGIANIILGFLDL
jgi:hypothetical protein